MTYAEFCEIVTQLPWAGKYADMELDAFYRKCQNVPAEDARERLTKFVGGYEHRWKPAIRSLIACVCEAGNGISPEVVDNTPMLPNEAGWDVIRWAFDWAKAETPEARLASVRDYMAKRDASNDPLSDIEIGHFRELIAKAEAEIGVVSHETPNVVHNGACVSQVDNNGQQPDDIDAVCGPSLHTPIDDEPEPAPDVPDDDIPF